MLLEEIASGGMATVHLGRIVGAAGFARAVAIKRLHPQFARDPEFVSMLIDEARLASRVLHPNVVATLDVVSEGRELFLVMEYVPGCALSTLLDAVRSTNERIPPPIATAIMSGVLFGLHAAHEATTEAGEPLHIVHRDISPQNVLVGLDGVPRVHDFGIAKAVGRVQHTREGQLKGKLRYMAPEQLRGDDVTRLADVYSAGVVLWETLIKQKLFVAPNDAALFGKVLEGIVALPSSVCPDLPAELEAVLLRALDRDPARRYPDAREMALALGEAVRPASASEVSEFVTRVIGPVSTKRTTPAEAGTETTLRALPPGLLSSPAIEAQPRRLDDAGFSSVGGITRTETVQRAKPFVTDEEPSSSRSALSSSVPAPARRRAIGGVVGVALFSTTALLALLLWRSTTPPASQPLGFAVRPAAVPIAAVFRSMPAKDEPPAPEIAGESAPKTATTPTRVSRPRAEPAGKARKKDRDCKLLYLEDATGIRRVKRECL